MSVDVDGFRQAIVGAGLEPPQIIEPGRFHRFPGLDKGRGNRAGWCLLFRDGEGGVFGDWSTGLSEAWQARERREMTADERVAFQRRVREAKEQAEAERQAEQERAAREAETRWKEAAPADPAHPYLKAKGVRPHNLRQEGDLLLVPVQSVDGELQSLQTIAPDGTKRFLPGGKVAEGMNCIGERQEDAPVLLCEGWATGASLREATGRLVVVSFTASNLPVVARAVREKLPEAELIICADNDHTTEGNPGLKKGREAARAVGAKLCWPADIEGTDANDLHQERGLAAVKETVEAAVTGAVGEVVPARQEDEEDQHLFGRLIKIRYSRNGVPQPDGLVAASQAAAIAAAAFRNRLCHDPQTGVWHVWRSTESGGGAWEAADGKARQMLCTWIIRESEPVGCSRRYAADITELITTAAMLPPPASVASGLSGLIPFANGMLDPETLRLATATPETASTWMLPYDWNASAPADQILDWLRLVTGDLEVVQLMLAVIAALLRGEIHRYQIFLHLTGPGGTGKSSFLRLLERLVGVGNAVSTDLKDLEKNRFEAARLYGKRLAMITDSDRYGGSVNMLKAITGGDSIRLEEKYKQAKHSFVFKGLLVLASNEPLATTDHTSGLERRRMTIVFARQFTDREKAAFAATGGEARLHRQIPGLVRAALELPVMEMDRLLREPPRCVRDANLEALREGNPVADWILDCCVPDPEAWTQIGMRVEQRDREGRTRFEHQDRHLYPSYLSWCLQTGREPVALRRFSRELVDAARHMLGIQVSKIRHGGGMGIQGLRLREQWENVWTPRVVRSDDAEADVEVI